MPRHIRTFLLATAVIAVFEVAQVVAWFLGGAPSQLVLWAIAALFVVVGVGMLVYGARQEDEDARPVVYGAAMLPLGCFVVSAVFAGALLVLEHADADNEVFDHPPTSPLLD
jgi:hypothetical protein